MSLESTVFIDISLVTLSFDAVDCVYEIQIAVANLAYTANRKVLLGKGPVYVLGVDCIH